MSDQQSNTVPSYPDTITQDYAVEITTNWRNYISEKGNRDYIRAFEIPLDDITNLAALTQQYGGTGVRAYIGLATPGDPSSAKLAIVPIDRSGNDVLSTPAEFRTGVVEESTIFDFTNPCPQACDLTSPLFGG